MPEIREKRESGKESDKFKEDKEIKEALEKATIPFGEFGGKKEKEKTKSLKELTPEEKKEFNEILRKELEGKEKDN